jgi:hypothetical protein
VQPMDDPFHQEQGIQANGCFRCRLLFPDDPGPCPECSGGSGFIAAQMMDEQRVAERVQHGLAAYAELADGPERLRCLEGLLQTLFIYGGAAARALNAAGRGLDVLRADYLRLQDDD